MLYFMLVNINDWCVVLVMWDKGALEGPVFILKSRQLGSARAHRKLEVERQMTRHKGA